MTYLGGIYSNRTVSAGYSAMDYVQSGLVAMWDGIENVGYGQPHSSSATTWKDLTGNYDVTYQGSTTPVWSDNYIEFYPVNSQAFYNSQLNQSNVFGNPCVATIESVIHPRFSIARYSGMVGFQGDGSKGIEPLSHENGSTLCQTRLTDGTQLKMTFNKSEICTNNVIRFVSVFDGVGLKCTVYRNMTKIKEQSFTNAQFSNLNKVGWYVGRSYSNSACGFDGRIYAVRCYNRVLSGEELMYNYEIDRERFSIP